MSDKNIFPEKIEKILNKRVEEKTEEYINFKVGNEIIKFIPKWNESPAEMNQFIKDMKSKGFDNPDTIKKIVYKLASEGRLVYTRNREKQEFFQRLMLEK